MVNATVQPTYYRVTFTGNTPTNFNALAADADGGLDCTHAERYNRVIRIAGNVDATGPWTLANTNAILINGVKVTFVTGALTLAGVISTINALTQEHGVTAYAYDTNYLGLMNAPLREGSVIDLRDSVAGTLAKMGLPVAIVDTWPSVFGSASPTLPGGTEDIKINGVTVTFSAPVTVASVCVAINALTPFHSVLARPAGSGIQLTSMIGQPFTLANGSTGVVSDLGFTAGNQGGPPTTWAQSMAKERATMRWDAVVFELGQLISPVFLGEIVKTGTVDGTAALTTISWTLGYDRPSYLRIEDVTSAGTYLEGAACIKRLIATALATDLQSNQEIFDPLVTTTGDTCARENPTQILKITALKLDTDVTVIEANISVTQIANV